MENSHDFDLSIPQEKKKRVHNRKLVKKIVQFLSDNRGVISFQIIESKLGIKEIYDPELIKNLSGNPKVIVEKDSLRYKPTNDNIHNKEELKIFLFDRPRGCNFKDLKDAYPEIQYDLQELDFQKDIIKIVNTEKKPPQTIIYPRQRKYELHIDDNIKSMWHDIKVPSTEIELDKKLKELGYMDIAQLGSSKPKRKLAVKKTKLKKKRKSRILTKITNVHMAKTHANILNQITQSS